MSLSRPRGYVIVCAECGAMSASPSSRGWRGYLSGDGEPELTFYCPACSVAGLGEATPSRDLNARLYRDAHRVGAATFRVALRTAVLLTVADAELASAFDIVAAAGGSAVSVLRGGEAERTRVEFDLEAHNQGHANRLALELLEALAGATPSVPGGWILASVDLA